MKNIKKFIRVVKCEKFSKIMTFYIIKKKITKNVWEKIVAKM